MNCPFCTRPMVQVDDVLICTDADCFDVEMAYEQDAFEIEAQAAEVAGEEVYFEE